MQKDPTNQGSQRSQNSEDIAPEVNDEYNISFEKSAIKPIAFQQQFSTKSKVNLEKDSLMREQRLAITRALITTIVNRRCDDSKVVMEQSPSQVNTINTLNISASKSQVEESSIDAMNKLVNRIKAANGELAEVGDIGSENA